jgi:hypothetical protein
LGTGFVYQGLRQYREFSEARVYVRNLGLKSRKDWEEHYKSGKLPRDIPTNPNNIYASKGWSGMGDWLGTGFVHHAMRQYRDYEQARAFVHGLKLNSEEEWRVYSKSGKLPEDIPATPNQVYAAKGWGGMGDWLGTGTVAPQLRKYRRFESARAFARSLGLKSTNEWKAYCRSGKLPKDIPAKPDHVYAGSKGWRGMGDWLGTGNVSSHHREFRDFSEARIYVRSLGLKSKQDWEEHCKSGTLPRDIPKAPHAAYADKGWAGMGDWLGYSPKQVSGKIAEVGLDTPTAGTSIPEDRP